MNIFKSFYFIPFLCLFIAQRSYEAGMLKSLEESPKTWSILDAYESADTKKAPFLNPVKCLIIIK